MNDESLRRQLRGIEGEGPSPDFVDRLRVRVQNESPPMAAPSLEGDVVTMVDLDEPGAAVRRRFRPVWPLSAAAMLLAAVVLALVLRVDGAPSETAAATEARDVGDAWLVAIVEKEREAFVTLHAADLVADDTLMGYAQDVDLLTPARVSELYMDGFDAFQASVAERGDRVRSGGCQDTDEGQVRCTFTASLIGTDTYSYTVAVDLSVENRQIVAAAFTDVSTEPADLRSEIQDFLDEAATDEDRACLLLGFNTIGCGKHDPDFMRRYIAFYEARHDPADG